MAETKRTTIEEARRVGDEIGVDWSRFDLEQFRSGMDNVDKRGLRLSLEFEPALLERTGLKIGLFCSTFIDEDLARPSRGRKPCGDVHDVAEGRHRRCVGLADRPDECGSGRHADSDR